MSRFVIAVAALVALGACSVNRTTSVQPQPTSATVTTAPAGAAVVTTTPTTTYATTTPAGTSSTTVYNR